MGEETKITIIPTREHLSLSGVTTDQHHAQLHEAEHITGGDLLDLQTQSLENLLINGDFEIGDPPISWVLVGAGATLVRSAVQVLINIYSALLTRVGADCYLQQGVVDPTRYQGRTVTLGCWVWASVAVRARLAINDGIDIDNSDWHTGSSTWEWLTVTHLVNAAAANLSARGWILTDNTAAYFDGAMLVEGSLCPAFSPKPAELAVSDVEVFNGAAPVAWTDLDISALLGIEIGTALVMLKITETGNAANVLIAARRNGDADQFFLIGGAYNEAMSLAGQNSTQHIVLAVFTDPEGIIEIIADGARTITIDVMGYIKC